MDWPTLPIILMPMVCTILIPWSHLAMKNPHLLKNQKERSVRPKASPSLRLMPIPKLGMDTITVMVDMADIMDTVDTTDIPMVDTTGIPMDTVIMDGANRYFNLDQTNSKFRS